MSAGVPEQAGSVMDERDGFICWLRSEFVAANAIIDHLVRHLCSVGDPGEYDQVCAAVQVRRHHWAPIVHMQNFFSVSDISQALRQSRLRRRPPPPQPLQPRYAVPPSPFPHHSAPFTPSRHRHDANDRPDLSRTNMVPSAEFHRCEHGSREGKGLKEGQNVVAAKSPQLDSPITDSEKNPTPQTIADGCSKVVQAPLEYATSEIIDGKPVNTVEGLKVYEGLIHMIDIDKIMSFVNETKTYFRQGGLTVGQTVTLGKRPLRYHGSLIIQLGVPMIEGPLDDDNPRETRVDAVPGLLQGLFDRFFQQGIIPSKPDYCVIDFFDEGEYSHPQQPPTWYGRPVCTLCLTECDMVFGRTILGERGSSRGPLKLSLCTGSLVVLQGRSADVAKRCIPSSCKQRILLTFGKSVPRKFVPPDVDTRYTPTSSVLPAPMVGAGSHYIPPVADADATVIPFQEAAQLVNTTAGCSPDAAPPCLPVGALQIC